jgi:hypothetical protein
MQGGGRGQGQGQGRGRLGGRAAGPGGYCVCPSCGHRVPHKRGTPCTQLSCSKCGTRMSRS